MVRVSFDTFVGALSTPFQILLFLIFTTHDNTKNQDFWNTHDPDSCVTEPDISPPDWTDPERTVPHDKTLPLPVSGGVIHPVNPDHVPSVTHRLTIA